MSKYDPLKHFLAKSHFDEVPMTFADIERVLGFKLPEKSQCIRAWWSNNPGNNVMTKVWLDAGFRSERVDMESRKLVFRRTNPRAATTKTPIEDDRTAVGDKASRRHPIIGALEDVTWIAPDVDLTEPADPEWADIIEDPNWGKMPQ